jgi:hypothetical protein
VASLTSGDANCANGGASVTDGSGNTGYACTGATGPAGPQGSSGSSGVQIDAGEAALVGDGAGGFLCNGFIVGADAGRLQFSAYRANGVTECVISGFPSLPVVVSITALNSGGLPEWSALSDVSNAFECPGSGVYCLAVSFTDSALQTHEHNPFFSWEVMQNAPSVTMSSAAVQRQRQAVRRMSSLARIHRG